MDRTDTYTHATVGETECGWLMGNDSGCLDATGTPMDDEIIRQ